MKASVIIPTRNRADSLAQCLASLARQTLAKDAFEVLVIDNGSTDHTAEVARQNASSLQLSYFTAMEPGLHVGRHEGMRRARSDVLMFTDDDIEAEAGWVEAVAQNFMDPSVALVGGNNHPLFEAPPPAWLVSWWERPVYKGRALEYLSILDFGNGMFETDPAYVWGCNFSVRRDVLLAAGGFHPDALPKERLRFRGDGETHVSDMIRSSGGRTLFDSRASVRHRVSRDRMTRAYFEQRAYAQGISDSYTEIRRRGGLGSTPTAWLDRKLRQLRAMIGQRFPSLADADPAASDLACVRAATATAYWQGYAFHRQQVRQDPALLEWVLKADYLQ